MQTAIIGAGEAAPLLSETGFDRSYWRAVRGARALGRLSSRVALPPVIELPTDRPFMIAANHSSLYDLPAALVVLGHYGINARIGVNSRFFSNPVGGRFLHGIGCIPFSREDKDSAEQAMVGALLDGQSAAIMPEGRITRPRDQENGVGPARPGVSRIARRADAAILPVGFAFANETWRPGTPLPMPRLGRHEVVASIGPPVVFDGDDHIANAKHLMSVIGELVMQGRSTVDAPVY